MIMMDMQSAAVDEKLDIIAQDNGYLDWRDLVRARNRARAEGRQQRVDAARLTRDLDQHLRDARTYAHDPPGFSPMDTSNPLDELAFTQADVILTRKAARR